MVANRRSPTMREDTPGGSSVLALPAWPCWAPRFLPVDGVFDGGRWGSDAGGVEELREFVHSRSSSASMR